MASSGTSPALTMPKDEQTAAAAYRDAAAQVPAAGRTRAAADAALAEFGAPVAFANRRTPFAMLDRLPEAQKKQIKKLAAQNGMRKSLEKLAADPDWNPMELVDVVDAATAAITHQVYVWPYGCGSVFVTDTTNEIAAIIQHSYQMTFGDLPFRRALAAAYAVMPLSEIVDFRLDEEARPPPPPELCVSERDRKRLKQAFGSEQPRDRSWDELEPAQQALIREVFAPIDGHDQSDLADLGLPPLAVLRREAGFDAPTVFETKASGKPVWRWLQAAISGEVTREEAVAALGALTSEQVSELALRAVDVDEYHLFVDFRRTLADTEEMEIVVRAIQLFAALVDTRDDAIAFAGRATEMLAKGAQFWLAGIATFSLASRARRRNETFLEDWMPLALTADFCPRGVSIAEALREVFPVFTPAQRAAYVAEKADFFGTVDRTTRIDGAITKVVHGSGMWVFADLVPTPETAHAVAEAILAWYPRKQPIGRALEVVRALGPLCIAPLEDAAGRAKGRNKKVLLEALEIARRRRATKP